VVRGGVLLELDVEHGTLPGDAAEASIAALIERRAQEREQADREASVWAKSADLLTNPAKHGCRHDERDSKALKAPR
jgi:hypothetical protein